VKTLALVGIIFIGILGGLPAGAEEMMGERPITIPLGFTENRGQVDAEILYYARTPGYRVGVTERGIVFEDGSSLRFLGTGKDVTLKTIGESRGRINFFSGHDPRKWHIGVYTYSAILYRGIYEGVDLKLYGNAQRIEYDWIVKPGADPRQIRFNYHGVKETKIDADGNLLVQTDSGRLTHRRPVAFQMIDGKRVEIDVAFSKLGLNQYGFKIGHYNPGHELVIDPLIMGFSTYLGGRGKEDMVYGETVDADGNIYICGRTNSRDFPVAGAIQNRKSRGDDCFVSKIDPRTGDLVFSTYLGGNGDERGYRITLGPDGTIYVIGVTYSDDFPVCAPYQATNKGHGDAFIARLSAGGDQLLYSTYLGGSGYDAGKGIKVDGAGHIYATGLASDDFPVKNPAMEYKGEGDAFVCKLGPAGGNLLYSTFIGGVDYDSGTQLCVEDDGAVVVTGITDSFNYPTVEGWQGSFGGGRDTFLTKLDAGGQTILFSTYIGGSGDDECYSIERGSDGVYYLAGSTKSTDFPVITPYQKKLAGSADAFVLGADIENNELVFSTYFGGTGDDYGRDLVVDAEGGVYFAGQTHSWNFPLKNQISNDRREGYDFFVSKLNAHTRIMEFSTRLGGSQADTMAFSGISRDSDSNLYIVGNTQSRDLATKQALQPINAGGYDIYATKLMDDRSLRINVTWPQPYDEIEGYVSIPVEIKADFPTRRKRLYIDGEQFDCAWESSGELHLNSCLLKNGIRWLTFKVEDKRANSIFKTIPVQVKNAAIALKGRKQVEQSWLISKLCKVLEFTVQKESKTRIAKYTVQFNYWKYWSPTSIKVAEIQDTNPDIQTQTFKTIHYDYDKYKGWGSNYIVFAYSAEGKIIGISNRIHL
jgi:hypothetical protein